MAAISFPIYKYPYREGNEILVCRTNDKKTFFFLQKGTSSLIPLNHIWVPVNLDRIPEEKLVQVFSQMFPSLTFLQDGSYNLRFSFKMLGGMETGAIAGAGVPAASMLRASTTAPELIAKRPEMTDKELAVIIKVNIEAALPAKESVSVSVSSKKHKFPGETIARDARIITVSPFSDFSTFFVYIKRVLVGVSFTDATPFASDIIRDYVLGIPQTDAQRAEAEAELHRAFADRRGFTVIISQDGRYLDFHMEGSKGWCVIQ